MQRMAMVIKGGPGRLIAVLAIAALAALPPARGPTRAAPAAERPPGGAPADVAQAANDPDEYAWRLFFYLNRQAEPGAAGIADPRRSIRQYDPDRPVVWETWALVSGERATQTGSEVFRPDGGDPGPWSALPRSPVPAKRLSANLTDPDGPAAKEIRINRPGYDFVVERGLYSREGVQRLWGQAVAQRRPDLIQFPAATQVIKAQWRDLGDAPAPAVLARYHWRRIGGHVWGLAALHIATKDLTDWVWIDFEQADQPIAPGEPSRDSTTRTDGGSAAPAKGAVEGERRELTGSKWAYYRLRGVQISFTDPRGAPTRLSDSVIEAGFQHTSCITCHARAAAHFDGGRLTTLQIGPVHPDGSPPVDDLANADLGAPSPALFGADGLGFVQTDFVWSIPERAQPARR